MDLMTLWKDRDLENGGTSMLLWTVQNKKALKVLEDSIWYKEYEMYNRTKFVDEDYCEEITLPNGREIETLPIYCFASLGGDTTPFFGMYQMFQVFNYFAGYMAWDLRNCVLIELDVPEEKILSAKHHFKSYSEKLPGYDEAKRYEKWKFMKTIDTDEIAHNNYVEYVRNNRSQDNIECLLSHINKEDITAIRTFTYIAGESGYGTCKVETVYSNDDKLPTFTKTIYVNGDGYPRVPKGTKLVMGDFNTSGRLQAEFGMAGVYGYMTVEEALYAVNQKTLDLIKDRLKYKGLEWKASLKTPLNELFNIKGSFIRTADMLGQNVLLETKVVTTPAASIPEELFALGLYGINDVPWYLSKSVMPKVIDILQRLKDVTEPITQEHILLESLDSATIEGAHTTVQSVKESLTKSECSKSDQMVKNVIAATNWALQNREMSHRVLRHIWNMISAGVCENMEQQGDLYRKGMVYIGSNVKIIHTPEKPELLQRRMQNMFDFCNGYIHPILSGIVAHYYYTYIHPMCDGNGRLSRILMQMIWKNTGYERLVRLPVVSVLNDNVSAYYKALQKSDELISIGDKKFLDCTPFVSFMLDILILACDRYVASQYSLTDDESTILSRMKRKGNKADINIQKCMQILSCAEYAAKNVLDTLVSYGFLTTNDNNVYTLKL